MTDRRRARLEELTDRWRARHEARLERDPRTPADPEREARAATFFTWKTESPSEYAARYGAAMTGYTYDAYTYADPGLERWLQELGTILRQRGRRC